MNRILLIIIIPLIAACNTKESDIKDSEGKMNKPNPMFQKEVVQPNEDVLNHFRKLSQNRWGNKLHSVRNIHQIKSGALEQVFKNKIIFLVDASVESTAGTKANYHAIVVDNKATDFIENDNDALEAISRQYLSVNTSTQAFLLIKAFADLRKFVVCNKGHPRIEDSKKDYSQHIVETKDTWIISLALEINWYENHSSQTIRRYKFNISKSGAISIVPSEVICHHVNIKYK